MNSHIEAVHKYQGPETVPWRHTLEILFEHVSKWPESAKCPYCSRNVSSTRNLMEHEEQVHEREEPEPVLLTFEPQPTHPCLS